MVFAKLEVRVRFFFALSHIRGKKKTTKRKNGATMSKIGLDLETNIIDLESNINKLELLSNYLRRNFCVLDASTNPNAVLYYYNDAVIQCDIIHDYIEKVKEISNNIQSLLIKKVIKI